MYHHRSDDTTPRDEVENQYPARSLCPLCKTKQLVHQDGVHVGKIVEHDIVETQISDDHRYSCTVTSSCPGSFAKVSKWKWVPWR